MELHKKYFSEISFLTVLLLGFIFNVCICDERSHRVKRWFIFNKNTKFFCRLNGKDNIVPWNTIITHGWGFRTNYDLPDTENRKYRFFKRDVHEDIDKIDSPWGQEAYACIMKYVCEVTERIRSSKTCGIFCEIGNIISESKGYDADFFVNLISKCDRYNERCPYNIKQVPTDGE